MLQILLILSGDIEICPGPVGERFSPETQRLVNLRGLKIFHQNLRGLWNNLEHIRVFLRSFSKTDIFGLTETHTDGDTGGLYQVDGYEFINKPRVRGKGGGVGIYISDRLIWKRREDLEVKNIESIWIEIMPPNTKSYLVCVMNKPPDGSKYLHKDFSDILNYMLFNATDNNQNKEIILIGDINVNYLKPNDHVDIKSVLSSFGLKQMIKKPTRIHGDTKTLIDVFMTNNRSVIKETVVIASAISDHEMIGGVRKMNSAKSKPKTTYCRNYKNYNKDDINECLQAENWASEISFVAQERRK